MKTNIVDVLMYLFDNLMSGPTGHEREISLDELEDAGFHPEEINGAFNWLEAVNNTEFPETISAPSSRSTRIFTDPELDKLDSSCLDFLVNLEQLSVIDPATRELIMQCVSSLDSQKLSLGQFKRIVLIVLLNQPQQETATTWLEELLCEEDAWPIH